MLQELRIKNFAIIEEVDLTFSKGFNVLTGETGAGTSIILIAVHLLLVDQHIQRPDITRLGHDGHAG